MQQPCSEGRANLSVAKKRLPHKTMDGYDEKLSALLREVRRDVHPEAPKTIQVGLSE